MNISISIKFLIEFKNKNRCATKTQLAEALAEKFNLVKKRSVWTCPDFSMRFSTANEGSFSNVVLSLSALKQYDHLPFIVCIVKPDSLDFLLSNSTFLKKISHSSHQLRIGNIRGSFLGHDIMRNYDDIKNSPENFEALFTIHKGQKWDDNVRRLVRTTDDIVAQGDIFYPSPSEIKNIIAAPLLNKVTLAEDSYISTKKELIDFILSKQEDILKKATIDNVNLRGNAVEQIITEEGNVHGFDDMTKLLVGGVALKIEIKSMVLEKSSNPKAYNIDKMLKAISNGKTICVFCFVGIDISNDKVLVQIVSIFDKTILEATRKQFHWAGRNSRGVTQLIGEAILPVFEHSFEELIDIKKAQLFLTNLLRNSNICK